ncbi:MAG: glycosyltransferase 87 family protein, partial [Candidatus Limnocylindria bacterium]
IGNWTLEDMDAYWDAAVRLRAGEPLYREYADATAANVYRYAPWFAFAWIPLTFLPKAVVGVLWSLVLLMACGASLWPLLRARSMASVAAAGVLGSLLLTISAVGNVHALVIVALVFGIEHRSGALWIAVAASLKAVPILFVLVYAARRQWGRVLVTGILTVVLIGPMLFFDLTHYPTNPGDAGYSFFTSFPILWAAAATTLVGLGVLLAARRSPHAWLAMSVAVVAALPRIFGYDFSFVLAGLAGSGRRGS